MRNLTFSEKRALVVLRELKISMKITGIFILGFLCFIGIITGAFYWDVNLMAGSAVIMIVSIILFSVVSKSGELKKFDSLPQGDLSRISDDSVLGSRMN